MKKLVTVVFLLSYKIIFAQNIIKRNDYNKQIELLLYVTCKIQSTPMNFFNFKSIRYDPYIPYNEEANIQQPSIGLRSCARYGAWSISYTPFLHYGPLHHYTPVPPVGTGQGFTPKEQKKVLVDQEAQLTYHLPIRGKMAPCSFGIALGVLNSGQRIYLRNGPYNQVLDLRVRNVAGRVGFEPFGNRFPVGLGFHFLYDGIPNNRVDKLLYYSLSVEYRILQKAPAF